jgi:hypothetical protein
MMYVLTVSWIHVMFAYLRSCRQRITLDIRARAVPATGHLCSKAVTNRREE